MDTLNIVVWLIIGALAGLITALITNSESTTETVLDVIIGVLGGFIGGFALNALNATSEGVLVGINISSAGIALFSAAILLAILEFLRRASE